MFKGDYWNFGLKKQRKDKDILNVIGGRRNGDGLDPREEQKADLAKRRRGKTDYSVLRLAGQIKKVLDGSLAMAENPVLDAFAVSAVEPSGSDAMFIVQVFSTDPAAEYAPREVQAILNSMKGYLRTEVAQAVHRKNAPDLRFEVLPPHVQPY